MTTRVIVVGAGVLGLSCAVRLLEAGHRADVLARDLPLETTSAVAAAFWYPYLAEPRDRVSPWSAATYDELARLATAEPTSGLRLVPGTETVPPGETELPWWSGAVPDLTRTDAGWSFTTPIAEMPVYLPWLARRVTELGGTLTRMSLSALPTAGDAEVVVDCSGLGARLLAADPTVTPVQGQVVIVEQVGLERWALDESGPTYVVPRSRDVVVGGSEVAGAWSRTPSTELAAAILARGTALVPELAGARALSHRVGLRPVRPTVRLERVGRTVHCYGHGGAGLTLSWGCADEVVGLVAEAG